jgi:hypothetical protein
MANDPKQSREQAESRFQRAQKKQNAADAGAQARAEHDAAGRAMREKTSRLKSLRLAKEAADQEAAASEAKPAAKKRTAKASATSSKGRK